jgi:hypothetical protein
LGPQGTDTESKNTIILGPLGLLLALLSPNSALEEPEVLGLSYCETIRIKNLNSSLFLLKVSKSGSKPKIREESRLKLDTRLKC